MSTPSVHRPRSRSPAGSVAQGLQFWRVCGPAHAVTAIRATASADSVILAIKRPGDVIIGRACDANWVELVGETGYARRTDVDTVRVLVDEELRSDNLDNLRFAGLGAPAVDTARLEQIGPGVADSTLLVVAPEVAVQIPPPPAPTPAGSATQGLQFWRVCGSALAVTAVNPRS